MWKYQEVCNALLFWLMTWVSVWTIILKQEMWEGNKRKSPQRMSVVRCFLQFFHNHLSGGSFNASSQAFLSKQQRFCHFLQTGKGVRFPKNTSSRKEEIKRASSALNGNGIPHCYLWKADLWVNHQQNDNHTAEATRLFLPQQNMLSFHFVERQ